MVVPSLLTYTFCNPTWSDAVPLTVTTVDVRVSPSLGEVIVTTGGMVSGLGPGECIVTGTVAVTLLSDVSVTLASIVLCPSTSVGIPDHEVVPAARTQAVLSELRSMRRLGRRIHFSDRFWSGSHRAPELPCVIGDNHELMAFFVSERIHSNALK